MLFSDPIYIFLFLPLVVAVYFLLNNFNLHIVSTIWLVASSLFFYAYWDPRYLFLLLISVIVNFAIGKLLSARNDDAVIDSLHIKRKMLLIVGVLFNALMLGYYKYADFFIDNINMVTDSSFNMLNLVLPLAISFFTFQQIAYLVDAYKHKAAEYGFLNYCLFVTFFPQLIAGPIVHHKEMMPQFSDSNNTRINWNNVSMGTFIFSMGLFKKVFIADTFAEWAVAGYDSDVILTFFDAWGTSLSYTLQLYYDFSGYSDMAIGAALMMNIKLPINFNSPYKAANIADFWKRWHMTLMRWLRDYIFLPLRRRKMGELHAHFSIMMTFLFSGIWHGAGWLFVIFGILHGLALSTHRVWKKFGLKMPRFLGVTLTILFFNFTLLFFRSENIDDVWRILSGMSGMNGIYVSDTFHQFLKIITNEGLIVNFTEISFLLPFKAAVYTVIFGTIAVLARNSMEISAEIKVFRLKHMIFTAFSFLFVLLANTQTVPSTFLYFNF